MTLSKKICFSFGALILFLSLSLISAALIINSKSTQKRQQSFLLNCASNGRQIIETVMETDIKLLSEVGLRDDICIPGAVQPYAARNAALRLNLLNLIIAQSSVDYVSAVTKGALNSTMDNSINAATLPILQNPQIAQIIKSGSGKYTYITLINSLPVLIYAIPVFFTDDNYGALVAIKSLDELSINLNKYANINNVDFYLSDQLNVNAATGLSAATGTNAATGIFISFSDNKTETELSQISKTNASSDLSTLGLKVFVTSDSVNYIEDMLVFAKYFFMLALAFCVASFALLPVLTRSCLLPVLETSKILKEISMGYWGKTRLKSSMDLYSYDELMTIPAHFKGTIEKINKIAEEMKHNTGVLCEISEGVATHLTNTANITNQFTENIHGVKLDTDKQCVSVDAITEYAAQIKEDLNTLISQAKAQMESLHTSLPLIKNLCTSLAPVLKTIETTNANLDLLLSICESGKNHIMGLDPDLKNITKEFGDILTVNEEIQNDKISTSLKNTSLSVLKIEALYNSVINNFDDVILSVENIKTSEKNVRAALESLNENHNSLLEPVNRINNVTQDVEALGESMLQNNEYIKTESAYLKLLATTVYDGIKETIVRAEEINTSINDLKEISNATKEEVFMINKKLFKGHP